MLLIFTDMDGSLLDHYSYSHAAAAPLLQQLEQNRIPVIPATSKTRAELLVLRKKLNNQHPFIVENGAAVFIPEGYFSTPPADTQAMDGFLVKSFCQPRKHWQAMIAPQRQTLPGAFSTFADSSVETITGLTGLNPADARLAMQREYGEPVQWLGDTTQRNQFIDALEQAGARVLVGGRFMHVSGDTDKGKALQWLSQQYRLQPDSNDCYSIAIGDSQNDIAMLEAADHALVIRSPAHQPPVLSRTNDVLISQQQGPAGWSEGLQSIIASLPFNPTQ